MIQKFKIVGKTVELTVRETDKDGSPEKGDLEKKALVHPDLERALNRLRVHWALMMGYLNPKQVKNVAEPDEKLVEPFHIYGYAYSGGDDGDAAISILGRVTAMGGHSYSVATHAWRVEGTADGGYLYMPEVRDIMEAVKDEVDSYLDGSKRGKDTEGGAPATAPAKEKVTHARVAKPEPQITTTKIGAKLPSADPEAMARVAGASFDGTAGEYQAAIDKSKKPSGKRPPQSPANPAGA